MMTSLDAVNDLAEGYWSTRAKKFVTDKNDIEGWKNLQDALKNDAAAWSIFAALLMTVGFSGLFIGSNNFNSSNSNNNVAKYFYIGGMGLCAASSFLAVVIGTLSYTYFAGMPPKMMITAVQNSKQYGVSIFVYAGFFFIFVGCIAGSYIFFDADIMIEMILISGIMGAIFLSIMVKHVNSIKACGLPYN